MVLTLLFLGAYVATLLIYQAKQPVDRGHKLVFDTVATGLMLGLGLNFFEVLKDMAKIIRWRILSSRYFEVRDVDLILGWESLLKVFQMMIQAYRKPPVFLICLVWLLVNLAAQISVATLPLFASLRSGYNSSGITTSQGDVSVPKLDCFYRSNTTKCADKIQYQLDPAVAHTYGQLGTYRGQNCSYQSTEDINNGPQTCPYFIRNDRREFAVRYADSNPTDLANAYPYYGAERIVTTTATNCNKYLPPGPSIANGPDGIASEFVWQFENSTGTYSLTIPRSSLAVRSTTYIWNGTNLPLSATWQTCGQRCVVLYALRDMFDGPNQFSIFQCHITVSPVSNATDPVHELSDGMARTAAASIALSGRWRIPCSNCSWDWRQFQLYQDGAEWAARVDDSPEDVGALMAQFAAAALATMAQRNPTTIVPGHLPTLGYQTDLDWTYIGVLTGSIAAAHLLFVLLILWLARPVIVVDDSYLVMAQLLKGLVKTLPEGDELRLLQRSEVTSAVGAGAGEGPGSGAVTGEEVVKAKESRPLFDRSPLPSARNLDDGGTALTSDARGRKGKRWEQVREDSASEMGDQGMPERTVRHMV